MSAILSALSWIFGRLKLGELAGFVLKKIAFSKIVLIEIAMYSLMVIYFGALLTIAGVLFVELFNLAMFIKDFPAHDSGNEVTSTAFSVLSTLGIIKAFWDVANIHLPLFISLFLVFGTRVGIKLLEKLRKSISGLVKTYV